MENKVGTISFFNKTSFLQSLPQKHCIRSQTGYGSAIGHYGEILQGVFVGTDSRTHHGLVTLPCNYLVSNATFIPSPHISIVVEPPFKIKSYRAAELTLKEFDVRDWGGYLKIHSNIFESWGLGSSSCDVVATIRAVANAFEVRLSPSTIARLAVTAETASDSVMFDNSMVLFAQREGKIIEGFNNSLPPLLCLGFNTDPTEIGVNTLSFKLTEYNWQEIETFKVLRGLLRYAVKTQNPSLIGRVASASAHINQRYLPKPAFAELEQLVSTVGALGLAVAHSGTVATLLFDPQNPNTTSQISNAQVFISQLGFGKTWQFQSGVVLNSNG